MPSRILAFIACSLALAADADTLFVVGSVPVSSADAKAVQRLETLGQSVTVIKDSASTSASANGMDLIVISDSVAPGKVNSKFTLVAVPVIVYEPWVYDDLGMTGSDAGTHYGRASNQTALRMRDGHPLAAGLTGIATVGSSPASFSWGKPSAAAFVAATLKGNTAKATTFAYEAGALLASGISAPARRVAIHPNTGAVAAWNANGGKLFDAAIRWTLGEGPQPTVVRILPLGDSITRGRKGRWTYRRDLEASLAEDNCAFDYVGRSMGPDSGPGDPLVDRDHEGHGGYRTDEILAGLPLWLPGNTPDWVLLHIGTNDVLQGKNIQAARANISGIVDLLRGANPGVGVLLAQIIPNLPANEAVVVALNDAIVSLAAQKHTPASPVIVVDHYSGYSTFTNNFDDQIHPNASGEAMMAERWYQALRPQIAISCQ
jgi:lysophospholipase L1-like esterase